MSGALPDWYERDLTGAFKASVASVFLLHGDIQGLFPNPDADDEPDRPYVTLTGFFEKVFDGGNVVFYDVASGLRFLRPDMARLVLRPADGGGDPIAAARAGLAAKRAAQREPDACLPYAYVTLSHKIDVRLPVDVHFRDCISRAVELVDGDKLILSRRPVRVVGEGEPINILDDTLQIAGYLTGGDGEYIEAAKALGLYDYMLSFVERTEDVAGVTARDPNARIVCKIESRRGLDYVRRGPGEMRLMAVRDDLFVQLGASKADYIPALESIVRADPSAIAASHILGSLEQGPNVSSSDVADIALLLRLGYRHFMLSDTLCFRDDAFVAAMDVLSQLLPR